MRLVLRRSRVLAIVLLFTSAFAQAQQSSTRRALFWKVTSPTTTVYLLGSIHLTSKDFYPLPKQVEDAFAASKVLVVEVNMKNYDTTQMATLTQARGVYTDGTSLTQHISKSTSDLLDTFCQENAIPRAALEPMKPWMVSTLAALLPLQKAGLDPEAGIDLHFMNQVAEAQRIEELETMEFQLDLLASGSEAEQDEVLAEALKHSSEEVQTLQRFQDAFLAADADGMKKIMDEKDTGPKAYSRRILEDRNVTMTQKIDGYLKGKEPVFVVVGSAHMVGKEGIVQLLRDKNYKVEQLFGN